MDGLRLALILAGIALVAVVYFLTARGRQREDPTMDFDSGGAWSDDSVDPLLDDLPQPQGQRDLDPLEETAINPRVKAIHPQSPEQTAGNTEIPPADVDPSEESAAQQRSEMSEPAPAADEPRVGAADAKTPPSLTAGISDLEAISTRHTGQEPHLGSLDAVEVSATAQPLESGKTSGSGKKKKPAARAKKTNKKSTAKHRDGSYKAADHADAEPLVVVINIMAREGERFPGVDVEEALQEAGLRYGEKQLFHYRGETQPSGTLPVFTALNTVKPGTLSPDDFPEMKTPGIALVLRLPGPETPAQAFELMYTASKIIADYLGGTLCDERRNHLTPQALNHLREQIAEYSRKLRIPTG